MLHGGDEGFDVFVGYVGRHSAAAGEDQAGLVRDRIDGGAHTAIIW